jgi:hypothetical protein
MNVNSPTGPPAGHTSHSQLSSFLRCGKAYELQRIIGVPESAAMWLIGGSAFHEASENNDRRRYSISGK